MKTKICSKCKKFKSILNFSSCKYASDKLTSWCKQCINNQQKIHLLNNPWIKHWYNARTRCANKNSDNYKYYGDRGIKCLITKEEIKKLWFRDKAYLMKYPTIDRENNDRNYTYDNCQFLEMKDNTIKRNNNYGKSILQFTLDGKFIREWKSATKAGDVLNISNITICANLKNRLKTAHGFIWRYKK